MTNKPQALVIDDHKDIAIIFHKALESAGYEAEMITDGITARKRLGEIVPALIVLDLHIPNISGEALLHQIRSDERLANTRILLATADAALAEKLGDQVDLALLKPIGFTQLQQLAERFLHHPKK